jgi:maltooligosyltrehalose trehalohydrolase
LRRNHPELADPRLDQFTVDGADDWLVLHRGALRVAVNLGPAGTELTLDTAPGQVLLSSADVTLHNTRLHLPAESFAIVTRITVNEHGQPDGLIRRH